MAMLGVHRFYAEDFLEGLPDSETTQNDRSLKMLVK
jgi:hypothetical protein